MTKERISIQRIHEATMELVEKAGMKFHHPEAVEILKAHGIRMEGNVAHFTEEQLMYLSLIHISRRLLPRLFCP